MQSVQRLDPQEVLQNQRQPNQSPELHVLYVQTREGGREHPRQGYPRWRQGW